MHKLNRDAPHAIDATPARRRGVVVYFRSFQPTRPTHRLISAQVRMPQISGLKWKDQTLHDLDVFRERKLKMTKKDDLEEFGDIGGAASLNIDRALIAKFLREECVVTGHNQIDQIQTFDRRRRDEDGNKGIAAGLYSRFYDWLCVQNPAAQLVSEDDVRTACRKIVRGGVEINRCVGCILGDGAAVLAESRRERSTPPRHRSGVASMAWRSTWRFRTDAP